MVASPERRFAHQQLVDEDAQRPIVDRSIMALVQDDLGRHVLGRPGERPRSLVGIDALGESKINL